MALFGKWEAVSFDNMEAGMKATGIPDYLIKPGKGATFIIDIMKKGDDYYKDESVKLQLNDAHFKSGQSFNTTNWLDQTQNWTINVDGDKMVEKRKIDHNVVTTTYELKNGLLEAVRQQGQMAPCKIQFRRA